MDDEEGSKAKLDTGASGQCSVPGRSIFGIPRTPSQGVGWSPAVLTKSELVIPETPGVSCEQEGSPTAKDREDDGFKVKHEEKGDLVSHGEKQELGGEGLVRRS